MRNFSVTVNGKQYNVAVEETAAGAAPVAAPAPAPAAGAGTKVAAPVPGTIMSVKANVGDAVKEGQVIMILEAMKMENDIVAPCDGTVTSIVVKSGDSVETNQTLATIG